MRECNASISGICLQLTEGFTLCREGECEREWIDQAADAARALALTPPRRARRRPTTGRLETKGPQVNP